MYTVEQLKSMTLEKRHTIYQNCLRTPGPKADEILSKLKETGLPYFKPKPVSDGDPIHRKIELLVNMQASTELMLDATARGRRALEPIDPLIAAELGGDYGGHNESTITAGYLVGQPMYALGYEKLGSKALKGCVAKTAATFRKKKDS
jgi:hypothetical protein